MPMRVSLNWLSDHLDLARHSTQQLADLLTFAGIEVEGIETRGVRSEKIVVAQVSSFEPHPNADRLRLCQVDDGSGQPRQIVCGAKNFVAGDKVPLALPGAVMPGNFEIKESKLRGVLSQGMMCSGRELGLSQDHEGLLILDPATPVGRALHEVVDTDTIFELEITPNRPDCLSHLGVARELSALAGLALKDGNPAKQVGTQQAATAQEIQVSAPDRCPFYTLRKIDGVRVGPSPEWLQKKLQSIGLRPINNVVDITNFVLMELGQPLHAFDTAKVTGGLQIRLAAEGEKFAALDGKDYALLPTDLVIADSTQALALAGVMGGASSGVSDSTTSILLESAYFTPTHVRSTSRRLGLMSDSSYRFERGVDPQGVLPASELATRLILEICKEGGHPAPQHQTSKDQTGQDALPPCLTAGAAPQLTGEITLDIDRANTLLGSNLSSGEISQLLSRLGMQAKGNNFIVPSYRADLQRPVDLMEEIARVHGIQNIPGTRTAWFADESPADLAYDFLHARKVALVGLGFHEAQTIKLISAGQLAQALGTNLGPQPPVPLKNPLSDDHTQMRPSLVPGLLASAAHNFRQGTNTLRLFEAGTVFTQGKRSEPDEKVNLALLLSGPVQEPTWADPTVRPADLYDLRAAISTLAPGATLKIKPAKTTTWLLSGQILLNSKPVGLLAQLRPGQVREMDGRHPIFIAEINVDQLEKATAHEVKFSGLPKFPGTTRDVALGLANEITHGQFEDFFAAQKSTEPLLESVTLFDLYTGANVAPGTKSMAFRLSYRDAGKTLESAIVDATHARILAALQKALAVQVR